MRNLKKSIIKGVLRLFYLMANLLKLSGNLKKIVQFSQIEA